MAKKHKPKPVEPFEFTLPELLASAQASAQAKMKPQANPEDDERLPKLISFLTPLAMPDPHHKGPGNPKTILRESMLLISFDKRQGMWKVNLSDNALGLGGAVYCSVLGAALDTVETMLRNGTFPWAAKESY